MGAIQLPILIKINDIEISIHLNVVRRHIIITKQECCQFGRDAVLIFAKYLKQLEFFIYQREIAARVVSYSQGRCKA